MSAIEAFRHIQEDKPYANCASAVVHALAPGEALEASSQAVMYDNAKSLIDIAACVAFEQARIGNYTAMYSLENGMTPSYFFRHAERDAKQSNDPGFFIGGLLSTLERTPLGQYELHVIGVMNHHKGKQDRFTVCDTARMDEKKLIRDMTAREMDARIIQPGIYRDFRALALIGYPLEELQFDPDLHGDLSSIENEMLSAEFKFYEVLERAGLLHLVQNDY